MQKFFKDKQKRKLVYDWFQRFNWEDIRNIGCGHVEQVLRNDHLAFAVSLAIIVLQSSKLPITTISLQSSNLWITTVSLQSSNLSITVI